MIKPTFTLTIHCCRFPRLFRKPVRSSWCLQSSVNQHVLKKLIRTSLRLWRLLSRIKWKDTCSLIWIFIEEYFICHKIKQCIKHCADPGCFHQPPPPSWTSIFLLISLLMFINMTTNLLPTKYNLKKQHI